MLGLSWKQILAVVIITLLVIMFSKKIPGVNLVWTF